MKRIKPILNIPGLLAVILLFLNTTVWAEPPNRVARLNHLEGNVSFLPAGESEWVQAQRNFTLTTGDSLWNDKQAHAMLQLPQASICLGAETGIEILNLNNEIAQIELQEGSLILSIANLYKDQSYEIDTPNLAFTIKTPGTYRVDVDATVATMIRVDNGSGEVYGEQDAFFVEEKQAYRFLGTNLEIDDNYQPQSGDTLDEWCYGHLTEQAQIRTEHVSTEVVGYEDLQAYGSWEVTEEYGYVWTPTEVVEDWAPYRVGCWSWVAPWGWTWVSEEPWGFAPYHYGRWVFISEKWFWVPGDIDIRPIYAPALVVFSTFGDDVAWFPLGPGEIYVPPYPVNQIYFSLINRSDPRIDRRNLPRAFRGRLDNVQYRNLSARNGISAVSRENFRNARRVDRALVRASRQELGRAQFRSRPEILPDRTSVLGSNQIAKSKPPKQVVDRKVLSKEQVPPAPLSFEQRKALLEQNKGRPLSDKTLENVKRPQRTQIQKATDKTPQKLDKGKPVESQRPQGDARQQRQEEFKRQQLENLQKQNRQNAREDRLEQRDKRLQDREQRKQERIMKEQREDRQLQQQQQDQKVQDQIKGLFDSNDQGKQQLQQDQQKVQEQQKQIQQQIKQRREQREGQVKPFTTPDQQTQPGSAGQQRLEQQQQDLRQRRDRQLQESIQDQSTQQKGLLQEQQEQLQDQTRRQQQEQQRTQPQDAQEGLQRSQEQLRQRRQEQLDEQQQRMRERQLQQQQNRQQQLQQQQQQQQQQMERSQRIQQEQLQQQQQQLQQQQLQKQQQQLQQQQQRQLERQQRQQEQLQQQQMQQQQQQQQIQQQRQQQQQLQQEQQQQQIQQQRQQQQQLQQQQQQQMQQQQQQLQRQQSQQQRQQQRQQQQLERQKRIEEELQKGQ